MQPHKTFLIAEAGVNHNGSIELAKKLIDAAVMAGADAVKFQSFVASSIVTAGASKAEYQITNTGSQESQLEMLKKLELSHSQQRELHQYCQRSGIQFLSTPFDTASLNFLTADLGLETIKVGSGELTNAPFLFEVARLAKNIILSTGMSTIDEVADALGVIAFVMTDSKNPSVSSFKSALASSEGRKAVTSKVTLLHCTTDYPTVPSDVNLQAMLTLREKFDCQVGFSDHSVGIHLAVAAVAMGATVIEKHLTIDRDLPGPDHKASLEPSEFKNLVDQVRDLENAFGDGIKRPTEVELKNKKIARRSLVALKAIKTGDVFTSENVSIKRPGTGRSPFEYWSLLGTKATSDIAENEVIQ
ncbi:MAG: N-acetylneuraminate synthase [Ilumatobacteraceae bacterium]|nr:N-acetylneuraminate synthase [Ilumatobacteraceae bacterium]